MPATHDQASKVIPVEFLLLNLFHHFKMTMRNISSFANFT